MKDVFVKYSIAKKDPAQWPGQSNREAEQHWVVLAERYDRIYYLSNTTPRRSGGLQHP